jgi:DNA-binding NtrC family response regulator
VRRSPAARKLAAACLQASRTALPVLIVGETGSGKEVAARAIHGESARWRGPFVSISAAAIPAELLEAELFGSRRGAFSGADRDRPGLLEAATGGSFLLDEVAEMPLALQSKVLRVLEAGRFRALGALEETSVDVRFLFTTGRDLRALVAERKFRGDLFYRLSAVEVRVPPLRERSEDIPELVERFRILAGGDRAPAFDRGALAALAAHSWPGNVRELRNVVALLALTRVPAVPGPGTAAAPSLFRGAAAVGDGGSGTVRASDVAPHIERAGPRWTFDPALLRSRPLEDLLATLEREHLLHLAAELGGDIDAMARRLGIRWRTLYDRLRRLGIDPRGFRGPRA